MSIKLMAKVWDMKGLTATEKLILLVMADYANDNGVCWPSQGAIADKCDCSRQYVNQTIGKFEKDNVLVKESRFKDNAQTSSLYRLTIDGVNRVDRGVSTPVDRGVSAPVDTEPPLEPPVKESSDEVVREVLTAQQQGFGSVCHVLGYDPKTLTKSLSGMVAQTWGILNKAGYSPAQIVRWYEEVWKADWRYKNGTTHPTVKTLRAEIGKLKTLDAPQTVTVVTAAETNDDTPW